MGFIFDALLIESQETFNAHLIFSVLPRERVAQLVPQ